MASDPAATKGKTVVAGYDGSDAARVAVDYAARLVGRGDRLLVVHAYGPPPDWLGLPEFSRILEDHRTRGQAVLDGLLLGGNDELMDVDFETELVDGSPPDALVRVADEQDADVIVIGSRGFGTVRAALGSVAQRLITAADRPVTVLPQAFVERRTFASSPADG